MNQPTNYRLNLILAAQEFDPCGGLVVFGMASNTCDLKSNLLHNKYLAFLYTLRYSICIGRQYEK